MSFFIGCGILLKQADRYVLIKETRNEKAGFYNIPAGTLELQEDFIECIMRETKEETGVDPEIECLVGVYQTVIASGSNVVFVIFAGHVGEGALFQSDEHDIIELLSYEEIVALDKAGQLRAPTILKGIDDYRAGQRLPLSTVHTWHIDNLATITVEKDH